MESREVIATPGMLSSPVVRANSATHQHRQLQCCRGESGNALVTLAPTGLVQLPKLPGCHQILRAPRWDGRHGALTVFSEPTRPSAAAGAVAQPAGAGDKPTLFGPPETLGPHQAWGQALENPELLRHPKMWDTSHSPRIPSPVRDATTQD